MLRTFSVILSTVRKNHVLRKMRLGFKTQKCNEYIGHFMPTQPEGDPHSTGKAILIFFLLIASKL